MAAKSTTGLSKETAGALSYVLGPVSGIIFLILEKNRYVRFHAMQSIVLFGSLLVLQWFFALIVILLPLVPLLSILAFVLWLMLIYKAWMGEEWEIPFIGKIARDLINKV